MPPKISRNHWPKLLDSGLIETKNSMGIMTTELSYPAAEFAEFAKTAPKQLLDIGAAYGAENLASDIRLASFGLDANDNDFVIGLLGEHLTPLSQVVHTMRGTIQTASHIEKLGPFFVGQTVFQSEVK